MQQRFGRNAADVEARAAELAAAFDDRGLEAELARADRAIVAAGAASDDNEIVRHDGSGPGLSCPKPRRRGASDQSAFRMLCSANVQALLRALLIPVGAVAGVDHEDEE